MENLIERLKKEVGLTEEQAVDTIAVIKDYMDKEGISIDWNAFFKGKYERFVDKTKSFVSNVSRKVDDFSEKVSDRAEDMTIEARRTARDLTKKVYDKLNDDED